MDVNVNSTTNLNVTVQFRDFNTQGPRSSPRPPRRPSTISDATRLGDTNEEIYPSDRRWSTGSINSNIVNRDVLLQEIAHDYEIPTRLVQRLQQLSGYEIVIVCDDSGSMQTTVDNTQRTRWNELCEIVKIVLRIGVVFDSNGVDIYFLNGQTIRNVKHSEQVNNAFNVIPRGYTPLVPVLREIFQLPAARGVNDKKLLVFVATDGAPTDNDGNENIDEFHHLMVNERNADTTHVAFLLCTDDADCVDYLTEWDIRMPHVDVTDDFNTVKRKVKQIHGDRYPFARGHYVVKALVGAIDPEFDCIDEPPLNGN